MGREGSIDLRQRVRGLDNVTANWSGVRAPHRTLVDFGGKTTTTVRRLEELADVLSPAGSSAVIGYPTVGELIHATSRGVVPTICRPFHEAA